MCGDGRGPTYFVINCARPDYFTPVLEHGGPWVQRLRGVRAGASRRIHAELNEAADLDAGDPVESGRQHRRDFMPRFPHFALLSGCCGPWLTFFACLACGQVLMSAGKCCAISDDRSTIQFL